MACDVGEPRNLPAAARRSRAATARRWLATLVIAEPVRRAFVDLAAATETDAQATAVAVRRVIGVTAAVLDAPCLAELERLARDLESQTAART